MGAPASSTPPRPPVPRPASDDAGPPLSTGRARRVSRAFGVFGRPVVAGHEFTGGRRDAPVARPRAGRVLLFDRRPAVHLLEQTPDRAFVAAREDASDSHEGPIRDGAYPDRPVPPDGDAQRIEQTLFFERSPGRFAGRHPARTRPPDRAPGTRSIASASLGGVDSVATAPVLVRSRGGVMPDVRLRRPSPSCTPTPDDGRRSGNRAEHGAERGRVQPPRPRNSSSTAPCVKICGSTRPCAPPGA